jgi:hypothetical protein
MKKTCEKGLLVHYSKMVCAPLNFDVPDGLAFDAQSYTK